MLAFSAIFLKQSGIFSPNFTRLLHVPIYARIQIFTQLSTTVTKLCHIKCDNPACILADDGHFEHILVVVLNMATTMTATIMMATNHDDQTHNIDEIHPTIS